MPPGLSWLQREDAERLDARRRQIAKQEAQEADRVERKLLRELDEEEARAKIDPPPELSPRERQERELVERVEALEGKQRSPQVPYAFNRTAEERQHRRREALRLLRNRREAEAGSQREIEGGLPKQWQRWDRRVEEIKDKLGTAIEECRAGERAARETADAERTTLGPRPTLEDSS